MRIHASEFMRLYDAARVMRFHAQPIYGGGPRVNLAEHSWGVAMLCDHLSPHGASAVLMMAALTHDLAECVTGDVPATTKWKYPGLTHLLREVEKKVEQELYVAENLEALSAEQQLILQWADKLELYAYAARCYRSTRAPEWGDILTNLNAYFPTMQQLEKALDFWRYLRMEATAWPQTTGR